MKLAHLSLPESPAKLAVVLGERAFFVSDLIDNPPARLQDLVVAGPAALTELRQAVDALSAHAETDPRGRPVADYRFAAAVLDPPLALGIGANYRAHAEELALAAQADITVFGFWPLSLTGHDQITSWHLDTSAEVDYEAELGVIIGQDAKNVSVAEALDYVWGYTVVNDITARDIQFRESQWSRAKSFDGFTPVGPVVVTRDQIDDPQDLHITATVNGVRVQNANTGQMVRSVADIIAELSMDTTLPAGTLISTGSPGGAGYSKVPPVFLTDGSVVTVAIEGIGALRTHCRVLPAAHRAKG